MSGDALIRDEEEAGEAYAGRVDAAFHAFRERPLQRFGVHARRVVAFDEGDAVRFRYIARSAMIFLLAPRSSLFVENDALASSFHTIVVDVDVAGLHAGGVRELGGSFLGVDDRSTVKAEERHVTGFSVVVRIGEQQVGLPGKRRVASRVALREQPCLVRCVTAVLSWPPSKSFQYIARSTAMFTLFVEVTTVEKGEPTCVSFVPLLSNRGRC